ncbi:uncharacterized protein RAG0_15189 [Rhynchosporium agropyri]|uniref:Uncharacterized protein n=1 Tax=Rhynchosporium agropyri TaxID=914238 RepID=A0A1E1LK27_9HELO|nr:uncharacterized protein RAG0_15189 [Rhynchosporium agropyri]
MSTTTSEIPLRRLSNKGYTSPLLFTNSSFSTSHVSSLAPTEQSLTSSRSVVFKPATSLQIQAAGKSMNSLPISTYELCIPIFTYEENGMAKRPKWLSVRPTRKSGSCVLVDAEDESQTTIARTTYRFGPGRPPVVRIGRDEDRSEEDDETDLADYHDLDNKAASAQVFDSNISTNKSGVEEFPLKVKRILSRTTHFTSHRYGRFEWHYCSRKEKASFTSTSTTVSSPPRNLLVLEKIFKNGHEREIGRLRVAQLIRGDGTRTPGTKYSTAGNGGRLEMCLERDGEEGMEVLIDEVTVLSTVLIMLKKEIDDQG